MSTAPQISHTAIYGLIVNDKQEILLIKKTRGPYKGLFDLPGGTPEFHETFEQTLEREVLEETGFHVVKSRQETTLLNVFETPGAFWRHVAIIYEAEVAAQVAQQVIEGQDSAGSLWLPIEEIHPDICAPFVNALKERALKKGGRSMS